MSSFWNFLFGAILIIIWIIAGGLVTQANIFIGPVKTKDNDLQNAYTYTFWAAFVTWGLIALFILLIILSIFGVVALFGSGVGEAGEAEALEEESVESKLAKENASTSVSWFTLAFLIFALILISITGVLATMAAIALSKSPNFDNTNANLNTAYKNCVIAASICLGAVGLLIIGIITYFIVGIQRSRRVAAEEKVEAKELRELEIINLEHALK